MEQAEKVISLFHFAVLGKEFAKSGKR